MAGSNILTTVNTSDWISDYEDEGVKFPIPGHSTASELVHPTHTHTSVRERDSISLLRGTGALGTQWLEVLCSEMMLTFRTTPTDLAPNQQHRTRTSNRVTFLIKLHV